MKIELKTGSNENVYEGTLEFGLYNYTFRCFRTGGNGSVFDVRILRKANPAILGEYLAWRANIEMIDSETIKLTVVKSLSVIERFKYQLPLQGSSATLRINRDGLLLGEQVFIGEVSVEIETRSPQVTNIAHRRVTFVLDFANESGSSIYSNTSLQLSITSIKENLRSACFTLIERDPNRISIQDNKLTGNVTAVFYCTYHSDGTISGDGQDYKGQSLTFSLRRQE